MNIVSPCHPLYRNSAPILLAGAMTAILFLLMQALIAVEVPPIEASTPLRSDAIMPPREKPEVLPPEQAPRPEDPADTPDWEPPLQQFTDAVDTSGIIDRTAPPTEVGPLDPGAGSSTIVPIFRIAPDYPPSALRRGIEGHVDLIFDVAPSGKTENIRVLDAQPGGVFEKAAIRTLGKWKYKPPVKDGVPYGQRGMTTRISFRLET